MQGLSGTIPALDSSALASSAIAPGIALPPASLQSCFALARPSDRHGWRECRRLSGTIPALDSSALASSAIAPGIALPPASDRHGWPLSHSPCASRHLHIHVQWRECRGLPGTIPALDTDESDSNGCRRVRSTAQFTLPDSGGARRAARCIPTATGAYSPAATTSRLRRESACPECP